MNLTIENILLVGSLLFFISIIVGKTSYKFGVPTLLLFLAIGMLAGSEGFIGIHFDDPQTAQFIGIVAGCAKSPDFELIINNCRYYERH